LFRDVSQVLPFSRFFFLSSFFSLIFPSFLFFLLSYFSMFDLRDRTKQFALQIIRMYSALPPTTEAQVMGKQVLRSGTSVGAHYREASRSRSTAEYISKIGGGLQELEETLYWLELLVESEIVPIDKLQGLTQEAQEIMAILGTMLKKAKQTKQ